MEYMEFSDFFQCNGYMDLEITHFPVFFPYIGDMDMEITYFSSFSEVLNPQSAKHVYTRFDPWKWLYRQTRQN